MPKVKSKSAAKKRFKKVGGAKVKIKRAKAFRRHLLTKKSRNTKRSLREGAYVSESDYKRILKLLPY